MSSGTQKVSDVRHPYLRILFHISSVVTDVLWSLDEALSLKKVGLSTPSKDWGIEKETKVYPRFLIEKKPEFFYSLSCIFPDYMDHNWEIFSKFCGLLRISDL